MSIQKDQVEGAEDNNPNPDDVAEFSGAWDELEAEESGQPAEAAGRQDEPADKDDQEGDEAGQGATDATPDADADTASRVETSDDIWANAPAPLREAYQAEHEARKKAENLVRSNGARAAQALNELNALRSQLDSKRDEGGATEEGAEAADPEERMRQLREEYPDVAGPILDHMAKLEKQVGELTASATAQRETQTEQLFEEQGTALREAHSDFDDVVKAPEYAEWLSQQVPAIQRVIQENAERIVNAAECAWVVDLFKRDTGFGVKPSAAEQLAGKRERQLQAGTGVRGSQPQVRGDDSDDYEDEWDRLDRVERQRAAGRK